MKRSIIKLSAACVLVFTLLTSCDIAEYNPSGITAETVYTTPDGFETLVNAAYSYARWWYGKEEGMPLAEMGTDLWTSGAADEYPRLNTYENLNAATPVINGGGPNGVEGMWSHLYSAINLVNAGISRVDESGLSEGLQTIREAELRFLRAFYYWHIVETWGGVHFTLEPTQGVQTTANRTPVEAFYEQIFADLQFAVDNLPVTQPEYARVTKPAAEAFLARMYLTRGRYQEAFDMAVHVIGNYDFALLPDYDELWEMDNLKNSEVIWAVNYSRDLTLNDKEDEILYPQGHPRGGNNLHLFFLMVYDHETGMARDIENGRPFNRYMPSLFLLDLFDAEKDARYEGSFQTVWYANSENRPEGMALGDTAVYTAKHEVPESVQESNVYTTYDRSEMYGPDGEPVQRLHYPSLSKFMDPTRPSIQEQVSSRDFFVIRLAEMYLTAAEAQFNMGNNVLAAEYINVIRERAALPGHEAEMRISPADVTLDFILNEWAREFAGEQMRWFILKRTGTLVERVRAHNPTAAPNIQEFHVLRPIPQSQLDAVQNKNEFTQNPGYS